MSVPDYQTLMLPILQSLSDREQRKTGEIISHVAEKFNLSEEDMRELIPSGRSKLIHNRVGWACTDLRKAGLISSPKRGVNEITEDGLRVLSDKPERIDRAYLRKFEKFETFLSKAKTENEKSELTEDASMSTAQTPEEIIGNQTVFIHETLRRDLLEQLSLVEPSRFEDIVVDLLVAMGYGGTEEDAGRAVGQTNDGGIDGIIKEDVLGLETIYVQAKRWQNTIPISQVRDFAGALLSKRSNKGVFITTSSFPSGAYEFVSSIDRKIILIDGQMLSSLMVNFNLGVSVKKTVRIKEMYSDYFAT